MIGSVLCKLAELTIWSLINKIRRAYLRTSSPHAVRFTPATLRSIRSAPIRDSSFFMWALTAGWVSSNRCAALVKLPS